MINRKRHHNVLKSDTDSTRGDMMEYNDDINDNYLLFKYFKNESEDLSEDEYIKSFFATPGECTRSKTIVKLNPFDLSNPEPKNLLHKTINWSHLFPNGLKFNKHQTRNRVYYDDNSLDSGFETESILSFASRSNDDDSNVHCDNLSEVCWTDKNQDLLSKLREISSPVTSCHGTGHLLPIVSECSKQDEILIPQISSLTLANILTGNHKLSNKMTVFDCRFPYEYSGGHIVNAVNVHTCQKLLQTLFLVKKCQSEKKFEQEISDLSKRLKRDDRIYVFYCEFSSYRAPKLAQCLRGLDRFAHFGGRDLFIPNVYVLCGGYSEFYKQYPQLCSPNQYVPMKQTRYHLRHNLNTVDIDDSQVNKGKEERKTYLHEVQESEKTFQFIMTKSTRNSDILQLFSSHPVIGGG